MHHFTIRFKRRKKSKKEEFSGWFGKLRRRKIYRKDLVWEVAFFSFAVIILGENFCMGLGFEPTATREVSKSGREKLISPHHLPDIVATDLLIKTKCSHRLASSASHNIVHANLIFTTITTKCISETEDYRWQACILGPFTQFHNLLGLLQKQAEHCTFANCKHSRKSFLTLPTPYGECNWMSNSRMLNYWCWIPNAESLNTTTA